MGLPVRRWLALLGDHLQARPSRGPRAHQYWGLLDHQLL
jgi:hypothetical protein